MEKSSLRVEVSKRGPTHSDFRIPSKRSSRQGHEHGRRHAQCVAKGALERGVPSSLKPMVFLELFSGSGNLGRTIARQNFWPVLLWDWCLGEQYDRQKSKNRMLIAGWFRSGLIRACNLGTPRNTFSRARDRPRVRDL